MKGRRTEFRRLDLSDELTHELTEAGFEQDASVFSLEELQEFLDADEKGVRADPKFKERLRRRLWDLLQSRQRA